MYSERKSHDIQPIKLIEVHDVYASTFKFDIPINPRLVMQMIHPQMGYLLKKPRNLKFEEILKLYDFKLVASYEHHLGQTLLCNEVCALGYWELEFGLGYTDLGGFLKFLQVWDVWLVIRVQPQHAGRTAEGVPICWINLGEGVRKRFSVVWLISVYIFGEKFMRYVIIIRYMKYPE